MKTRIILIIFCLFAFICISANAEEKIQGNVTLPLEQFTTLISATQSPSPNYSLYCGEYFVTVENETMFVKAKLNVSYFSNRPVLVPLFKGGIVVDKATIGEKSASLSANEKGEIMWAVNAKAGVEDLLEINFHTDVKLEQGFLSSSFTIPLTGIVDFTIDFPYDEVQAFLNEKVYPTKVTSNQHSVLKASIGGTDNVKIKWLPLPKGVKPELKVNEIIHIQHFPRNIMFNIILNLEISKRPLAEITIPIEPKLNVLLVKGDKISKHYKENNNYKIRFSEPIFGNTKIEMQVWRNLGEKLDETFSVPVILPQDSTYINGYIIFPISEQFKINLVKQEKVQSIAIDQIPENTYRQNASMAFQFWESNYVLNYTLEEIVPEFTASLLQKVTFGETTCSINAICKCIIREGSLHSFTLSVPHGFKPSNIEGRDVRDWSVDSDGKKLKIELKSAQKNDVNFIAVFAKQYTNKEVIPINFPAIQGEKRLKGFVTITPLTGVNINTQNPKNMQNISIEEIPMSMKETTDPTPLMAYSYLSQPVSLTLIPERYEKAAVENNFVEKMDVFLAFSKQGEVKTDITMDVLSADENWVSVRVLPGAVVRSAKVDDLDVSPAVGDSSDKLMIRIPRSKTQTSKVSLSYVIPGDSFKKKLKMNLPIPQIFLPINELGLLIKLPEGYGIDLLSRDVFQKSDPPMKQQVKGKASETVWYYKDNLPPAVEPEIRSLFTAVESFYVDNNVYPSSLDTLGGPVNYVRPELLPQMRQKYKLEKLGNNNFRVGVEKPVKSGAPSEFTFEQGIYYKATLLRGDEAKMKNLLTVKVNIYKIGKGLFSKLL